MAKKTVVSITGIRPDFIRMCEVFRKLDQEYNHILIHTGQHYDNKLSDVFFEQLGIRKPDYILNTGRESSNHYEQLSYLSVAVPRLFKEHNISPDLIIFLGDANTAGVSFPLKKEGYKIGHIEAGMRSYDKRMLEELNRTVCDHCSDVLFVYHDDYAKQLAAENITKNVFVVGNTIVEPFMRFRDEIISKPKRNNMILMDIHRPENFKYVDRVKRIFQFGNMCADKYGLPIKLLYFKRLEDIIKQHNLDLGKIEIIPLMSYRDYMDTIYNCKFLISDSGTAQEEPALLKTPVAVPRDFTERPQSISSNCSIILRVGSDEINSEEVFNWIEGDSQKADTAWLGSGNTSHLIMEGLAKFFD